MSQNVYSIALVRWKNERSDSHCMGVFSSLEKAKKIVEKDGLMISDHGYYGYVIIEQVGVDCPYNVTRSLDKFVPIWYEWNNMKETYEIMNMCPEFARHIVNWGIG